MLSRDEAEQRASQIGDVSYRIDLDLEAGAETYRGDVTIRFSSSGGDTFLEFVRERIDVFEVNGKAAEPAWDGSRIALTDLGPDNEIRVVYENQYDHSGEGFH